MLSRRIVAQDSDCELELKETATNANINENTFSYESNNTIKQEAINYQKETQNCYEYIVEKVGEELWNKSSPWFEMSKHLLKKINARCDNKSDAFTNAFCKGIELYSFLKIPDSQEVRHFDNACLPGDFIRSAASFYSNYSWRASSLIPSVQNETPNEALQDRFELLKNHRENFITTSTMDGDMTRLENILQLPHLLGPSWRPNLYTSDLGFQCHFQLLEEDQHLLANYGQILAGLLILAPGGFFVTKQFTFFRENTHWLLNFLGHQFKEVDLVKPETSKRDNSEIYIVAKYYQPQINCIPIMITAFKSVENCKSISHELKQLGQNSIFKQDSRFDFTNSILEASLFFAQHQYEKMYQNCKWMIAQKNIKLNNEVEEWLDIYSKFIKY